MWGPPHRIGGAQCAPRVPGSRPLDLRAQVQDVRDREARVSAERERALAEARAEAAREKQARLLHSPGHVCADALPTSVTDVAAWGGVRPLTRRAKLRLVLFSLGARRREGPGGAGSYSERPGWTQNSRHQINKYIKFERRAFPVSGIMAGMFVCHVMPLLSTVIHFRPS